MTGALLCGGQSARMGFDKAFLEYKNTPFVILLKDLLEQCFESVLLVGGTNKAYQNLGLNVLPDLIPGMNSLGGIYTALKYSTSEWTFIMACDMPFMQKKVIEFLKGKLKNEDALIPMANGYHQPLCAFYNRRCLDTVKELMEKKDLNLYHFLERINAKYLPEDDLKTLDNEMKAFTNINKPEDLPLLR